MICALCKKRNITSKLLRFLNNQYIHVSHICTAFPMKTLKVKYNHVHKLKWLL